MASVFICSTHNGISEIAYSLIDNRVRRFVLHDKVLFDEEANLATEGWREKLIQFSTNQGLNVDYGEGVPSFICGLEAKGELEVERA